MNTCAATAAKRKASREGKQVVANTEKAKVREFAAGMTSQAKAVWRHYYKKLKKQTRGGKLGKTLDGYLPGDDKASSSGLLWRGTQKAEIESLALRKRFKSAWTNANFPDRPRTYVAGSPQKTMPYATAGALDPAAATYRMTNSQQVKKHLAESTKDARIYGITKSALKRSDNQVRGMVGDYAATAPLKGGIKASEVRALLKPAGVVASSSFRRYNPGNRYRNWHRWKPVPLGDIQKKQFSRIDRAIMAMNRRDATPIGYEAGIPLTGRVPRDRWIKKIRDEDLDRRDANVLRAGATGAAAGSLLARGKLPLKARMAIGAGSGVAGVLGIRQATKGRRDAYGERQRGDKTAESIPALAGLGAAGYGAYKILRKKFKMSDGRFEFAKKEKRQMNPYVMAGLSGAASGAALGILPLLRRGVGLKTALRTAAGGAAAGGAIVGGGSLLGSAILGDPDKKEGAAFTKRAAVGGAIVGGTLGVAGGLVARRVPVVRKQVGKLAKEWRPAQWIKKAGPVKAAAIGGVAGGAYGAGTGADEGQQVDSIRNIRKDLKRLHGFSDSRETVKLARDWRDVRRESRSEAAKDYMTGAGVLTAGVGVGAGVGYAGLRGGKAMNAVGGAAREATKVTRTARVAGAKINRAGTWIKRQLTTFPTLRKFRLESAAPALAFDKPFHGYNKKRHAKSGGLNDTFRKKYNSEHGSNLKRPVTTEPSKLKPGSKAAKRRASFCARMGGMQGPTSKEGKLTPKGAALKRWNCSAKQELIEMNDRTYRPGSTAETQSMKQTPAIKEILKKENARGRIAQKLRTLMKVLPFEARYEFQTMAPMAPSPYDERERLKRQLLVTGAVATPVAGVGFAGWRSLRNNAKAMQAEEARTRLGQQLRSERRASMSVGGKVNNARFGPSGPIAREPLPIRKSMQPDTLERNQATNKAIAIGKRYESEIKSRYRAGSKMKMVHSRGERKAMRATLAMLRTKYKFARKGAVHQFTIYARDEETGRAAGFYDYVQGRPLTRKNPLTGRVESAPVTTGAFISAARRKAEDYNRTRKRGMGLVRDVTEVSQGKKTKKREWEKSWFQNKLQTAAGAAALLGAGVVYRKGGLRSAPGWAKSFRRGTDATIARAQNLRATAEDRMGKIMGLSARLKLRHFETYQDYYNPQGWDLRDARGNSARVFSPTAKKRMRRQAEWHEKKDAQRKLLVGAGLLGATATGAAGLLIGRRFPIKKAPAVKAQNIIKFPKKNAS